MSDKVRIELNEKETRINVDVPWARDVRVVKGVPGKVATTKKDGSTQWSVRKDMASARALRAGFGERLQLGPRLRAWARQERNRERNLRSLQSATDSVVKYIPLTIKELIEGKPLTWLESEVPPGSPLLRKRPERSYQRADIAMMAMSSCMNCNQVGTGKTVEAVGALYEAAKGSQPGPVVVVAPRRTLVNIWEREFKRYTDYKVYTSEDPRERKKAIEAFVADDGNVVCCVIAEDFRLVKYKDKKDDPSDDHELHAARDGKGNWFRFKDETQRELITRHKRALIIDEFHRTGLNGRYNLFHLAVSVANYERLWPMSGTPIGGKPERLWPVLHLIDPKEYKSFWQWAEQWLEVEEEQIGWDRRAARPKMSKKVGGIRQDAETDFYEHHKKHMVRRLKKEALPGIPDSIEMLVDTPMTKEQAKLYYEFDENNEVILDGKRISGSGILAKYTRLRQLANAAGGHSGKIEPLIEALSENGVRKLDYEPGARAYIGCSTKLLVNFVLSQLAERKIDALPLTGNTKDSKPIIDTFNEATGPPFVIVMTMQTGGSGLDLEAAGSAHLLDETWDPDEEEQFFGRGDRGTRTTPLRQYVYRTPKTIQDYMAEVAYGKKITNKNVIRYAKQIERMRRGV